MGGPRRYTDAATRMDFAARTGQLAGACYLVGRFDTGHFLCKTVFGHGLTRIPRSLLGFFRFVPQIMIGKHLTFIFSIAKQVCGNKYLNNPISGRRTV